MRLLTSGTIAILKLIYQIEIALLKIFIGLCKGRILNTFFVLFPPKTIECNNQEQTWVDDEIKS